VRARVAALAQNSFPTNVTLNDCSGMIGNGGQAQPMIAAKSTLHAFMLQNIDPTILEELCFSWSATSTAALNAPMSFCLGPGASGVPAPIYTTPLGLGINRSVTIIAATTGHNFSCTWR
jgi:hypothetical protein